jgi:carbon-monoxide dehydrogenase small subunit
MVMSALDLVARPPGADEKTIRAELEGNLCRCTGYQNIVKAVQQGAVAMAGQKTAKTPAAQPATAVAD